MERILRAGYLVVLALLPVHAFLTVWLISNVGHDTLISAWKEMLLALLVPVAAALLYRRREVAKTIFSRRVNQLILGFLILHLAMWALTGIELDAVAAGLLINLRFLAIFVLAQILVISSEKSGAKRLRSTAGKTILIGGIVVSLFGALQLSVLPADFLSHFGYGADTIEPHGTIDQNEEFIRINSTMRGPNPLGLYMILALPMLLTAFTPKLGAVARSWKLVDWKSEFFQALAPLLYLIVPVSAVLTLYGSHSRSGWLGAGVASALFLWWGLKPHVRRAFAIVGGVMAAAIVLLVVLNWRHDFIQHTVLHQDPHGGTVVDSTAKHWEASGHAVGDIADNPLGSGPGTAGPASFYNDKQTRIAENYYLQLGQEVGVIGLGLFIAICVLVVSALWRQRTEAWPRLLLASFAGLSVANFFLHAWAQDEIALIWWGLAGLYYRE